MSSLKKSMIAFFLFNFFLISPIDVFVYGSLSGSEQNNFFENANKVNITDIVCGHQHYNNFTLKYQNIRLTFALKSSSLAGYYKSENLKLKGATFFVLNNEKTQINNYFC